MLREFEAVGYETLFDICDEVVVATIALNHTTILEIKATIALHSDFKFKKVSPAIKATENLPKRVLHVPSSTFWSRTRK